MLHLVRHFGDQSDDGSVCGTCDVCDPAGARVLSLREPTSSERAGMESVLKTLGGTRGMAVGRLMRESLGESFPRREFDALLAGLGRAGLIDESQASFERDGETIAYRQIALSESARAAGPGALDAARMVDEPAPTPRRRSRAGGGSRSTSAKGPSGGSRRASRSGGSTLEPVSLDGDSTADPELIQALREWRNGEAKRRKVPAFRIFSNRVLLALAEERPDDEAALLAIKGVGDALVRKYGARLIELLRPS